jgi:hypothetical protein
LPKKNYEESDKPKIINDDNFDINNKEKEVKFIFKDKKTEYDIEEFRTIIKQNFSFHEKKSNYKNNNLIKNINSLKDLDENGLLQFVINDNRISYFDKKVNSRHCISAKNGRNIKSNKLKEKTKNNFKNKEFTENNYQYKKIKPINTKNNFNMYIDYNQISQSSSDNDIQRNNGTAEDTHAANEKLKYKYTISIS